MEDWKMAKWFGVAFVAARLRRLPNLLLYLSPSPSKIKIDKLKR